VVRRKQLKEKEKSKGLHNLRSSFF
jgi:hypothetical protein